MRVIAGTAGSIPLKTIEGNQTRPTQDRIKETLFNMIGHDIPDSVFLDMFAGSGGIGIEALSRGAKKAYFIDKNPKCIEVIKDNLNKTKLNLSAIVEQGDYLSVLPFINDKFDYIFIDPPYDKDIEKNVLEYLSKSSLITEDSVIIVESSIATDFSYVHDFGFRVNREKKYKTNKHVFISMD